MALLERTHTIDQPENAPDEDTSVLDDLRLYLAYAEEPRREVLHEGLLLISKAREQGRITASDAEVLLRTLVAAAVAGDVSERIDDVFSQRRLAHWLGRPRRGHGFLSLLHRQKRSQVG